MLNFNTQFGKHVTRRLNQEKVIWLTTVDEQARPQPRPVWFHWDGKTFLIFSQRDKAKLRHITRNPKVSLNFNTDKEGGDVAVFLGEAKILDALADSARVEEYLKKYRPGIKSLEMTVSAFSKDYSVPVLVTPHSMRGFVE